MFRDKHDEQTTWTTALKADFGDNRLMPAIEVPGFLVISHHQETTISSAATISSAVLE